MNISSLTILDLFSGIGGFSQGLIQAGFNFKKHFFAEVDKHAQAIYKHKFPESKAVGDVRHVRGSELGKINVITFGSPCQDFSLAGKRRGMDGERSSLITEAIRLIDECRPDFFIWENVKGTFSSNGGEDFAAILQAFTNLGGYRLEWQLLNTAWFLPQNRERIYLVGRIAERCRGQVFPIAENFRRVDERSKQATSARTLTAGGHSGGLHSSMTLIKSIHNKDYIRTIRSGGRGSLTGKHSWDMVRVGAIRGRNPDNPNSRIAGLPTEQMFEENEKGIANTLTSVQKDTVLKVKSATSCGYEIAGHGDSINYSVPNSETRRSRVGKGKAQTLDTACNQGVLVPYSMGGSKKGRSCINSQRVPEIGNEHESIRRLTEIECERLQGFEDCWTKYGNYNGEVKEVSATQRYKCLGNAVTVDVVQAVGEAIRKAS